MPSVLGSWTTALAVVTTVLHPTHMHAKLPDEKMPDHSNWTQKAPGDGDYYMGVANDLMGLFQRYNMDPMWTMRNAAKCWEDSKTQVGEPQTDFDMTKAQSEPLSPCLFR
ncbi:hypothetical protein B0H66DRAFT_606439 [Apodospora peruviana]|uniref:Uncharacterized protein n=1 Tax=Apodospora peruviana TaxID=516989 RepID=A0AAE0HZW0_9PEZI|nr:hypothetical protein B0H66DRAFT_606439 [Apodospora peruviana]